MPTENVLSVLAHPTFGIHYHWASGFLNRSHRSNEISKHSTLPHPRHPAMSAPQIRSYIYCLFMYELTFLISIVDELEHWRVTNLCIIIIIIKMSTVFEKRSENWSRSLSLRLVYPVLQYRRERSSLLGLLSEFGLISGGWLGSISPSGDWANALECWRSPSLRLVIPGIAVSPGVTHSDSHHLWNATVVKTRYPPRLLKQEPMFVIRFMRPYEPSFPYWSVTWSHKTSFRAK